MKLKIHEITDSVSFLNIVDSEFNYPKLLLKPIIKFIILQTQTPILPSIIPFLPPTITSISGLTGFSSGGDLITLTGTNLATDIIVRFSGVSIPVFSYSIGGDTRNVITPPHSPGYAFIRVTNSDGSYTFPVPFLYILSNNAIAVP